MPHSRHGSSATPVHVFVIGCVMLVLVDMDGVVSDFDRHIVDVYGKPMSEMTNKEKDKFWDAECVSHRFFANSPVIPEGLEFVKRVESAGIEMTFLTSTGGELQHIDIAKQKLDFLQRNGMGHLPVAFATGTKCKSSFAKPGCVLVDDREKVVTAFRERGGVAHLFTRDIWLSIFDSISSQ